MEEESSLNSYLDWTDIENQKLVTKYISKAPKMCPDPKTWIKDYLRDFPVVENRSLASMQLNMFDEGVEPASGLYKCDLGHFQIHTTVESFNEAVEDMISKKTYISLDIETSGLDPHADVIRTVQLTADGIFSHVLLCEKLGNGCRPGLRRILSECPIVLQNGVFDVAFLLLFTGVFPPMIAFDTLIAAQNLDAGYYSKTDRAFNLGALCKRYLNIKLDKSQQSTFGKHSNLPLTMEQLEYAANDTLATWRLASVLARRLQDCELVNTFTELDLPCMAPVVDLKVRGCPISITQVNKLEAEIAPKIKELETELNKLLGLTPDILNSALSEDTEVEDLEMNLSSSLLTKKKVVSRKGKTTDLKSSQKVLQAFHNLGYTDLESTGESTIGMYFLKRPCRKLSDKEIEEVESICKPAGLLLKHRDAIKKMDAFIISYRDKYYNPKTGCLHPSLNISGSLSESNSDGKDVATGRFSSSAPNIQQMDSSQKFRDIFTAPEGFMYVKVDASQQEVRIMAEVSGDDNLCNIYINEGDNPADVYEKIEEKITGKISKDKKIRGKYKAIVLGTGYGSGPSTIAEVVGITKEQAIDSINDYFKSFPKIKTYIKEYESLAKNKGFIANKASGRRRYWNHKRIQEENKSYLYKTQSGNFGIQSYAADCGKKAFLLAYEKCAEAGARVMFPIHDK